MRSGSGFASDLHGMVSNTWFLEGYEPRRNAFAFPRCMSWRSNNARNRLTTLKSEGHERKLVEAAQKNPGASPSAYELNFECIYAYVARRVGKLEEAKDRTSEVF
jgi:hypothetical protein